MRSKEFTHHNDPLDELKELVLFIQEREGFLPPGHASRLRAIVQGNGQSARDVIPSEAPQYSLREREQQVAAGLVIGQSYQEIADENYISINTVRHYVKVLYKKLDVSNRVQLIQKLRYAKH